MSIDISQLALPKVSPSGVQLLGMLSQDEADFKQMESVVSKDPTLASSIIKYANSPLYHRTSKISNLQTALGLLGIKNIRSAVVMAIMRSEHEQKNSVDDLIWDHSQTISILCRLITKKVAPLLADDMQFIGLIHDIGMLMLNHYDPTRYENLITQSRLGGTDAGESLDVLEAREFGICHDVVSIRVCDHFRFSSLVAQVLGGYHAAHDATTASTTDEQENINSDVDRMSCILSLAHHLEPGILAGTAQMVFNSTKPFSQEKACALLKLDDSLIQSITEEYQSVVNQD